MFLLTSSKPLEQPQLILPQACQTPSPRQGDTTLALPSNTRAVWLFLPFFHQGKKVLERSYFGYLPHLLLVHFQLHSFKRFGGGERSGTSACRAVHACGWDWEHMHKGQSSSAHCSRSCSLGH